MLTAKSSSMMIGVGKADITGPITKISTGYNSLGDLMEGLSTRLYARAFIAKEEGGTPVVYCSAELVHMTESIKPSVIKELASRGLTQYTEDNVMLSATHCHSSTSNTSWYALYDLVNGVPGYDDDSYKMIVKGIADEINNVIIDDNAPLSGGLETETEGDPLEIIDNTPLGSVDTSAINGDTIEVIANTSDNIVPTIVAFIVSASTAAGAIFIGKKK